MTKNELQNACTSPPREWLAIPKKILTTRDKPFTFTFSDIISVGGKPYVWDETHTKQYCLSDCHICAFIGRMDNEGEKVYEGHLMSVYDPDDKSTTIGIVCWHYHQWRLRLLNGEYDGWDMYDKSTILGHIHIKPWSDEVAELLKVPTQEGLK